MNFKEWIMAESTVRKLAIFDYDSTLANTPLQPADWKPTPYVGPDGRERYDKDWWVHPDSLNVHYDLHPVIVQEFAKARKDPSVRAVLLTGRQGMRTAHLIRGKLRQHGFYGKRVISPNYHKALERHRLWPNGDHPNDMAADSHEEFYKGDMSKEPDFPKTEKGVPASDTLAHKQYVIANKLMSPDIQEIDFWDDRPEHVKSFTDFFYGLFEKWPNLRVVNFHKVEGERITPMQITKTQPAKYGDG